MHKSRASNCGDELPIAVSAMGCGASSPSDVPAAVIATSLANDSTSKSTSTLPKNMSHNDIVTELRGVIHTHEARFFTFFTKDATGEHRSLWHDLPLFHLDAAGRPTGALNFVCEISKWTRKIFEIATKEPSNPIKQDEKKGELRQFKKGKLRLLPPHLVEILKRAISIDDTSLPLNLLYELTITLTLKEITREDPEYLHPDVGVGGDNDPLDVCEIGLRQV